jgi:hypothetical protein
MTHVLDPGQPGVGGRAGGAEDAFPIGTSLIECACKQFPPASWVRACAGAVRVPSACCRCGPLP